MAIGSGLGATLGIGAETSYGSYAAPTRWYPIEDEKFTVDRKFSEAKGMVGGSLVRQAAQTVLLNEVVKGSIKIPLVNSGIGLLLEAVLGNMSTPTQQGTTAAYQSVGTLQPTVGKSYSVQIGRPQTNGTITPFTYLGCKTTSMDLSIESGNVAELALDFVGQSMVETQTLVSAVYPTTDPIVFSFQGSTLSAGVLGSEALMANVRKASIKVARKLDEERFYIGGNGLLSEPIEDNFVEISGDLTVDFTNTTDWDMWVNSAAQISIILDFVGQQIATGYNYGVKLAIPVAQIEGDDPSVSGPKIVERSVKFMGLNNNANSPISATVTSTDMTL
jgi:hypothetical protein